MELMPVPRRGVCPLDKRWRYPSMVRGKAPREVVVDCAPRPWLTRLNGECAYPVAGHGAQVMSCCDVIRDTWRFNAPELVEEIQHDHALALVRHPFERARPSVEALFTDVDIGWQSDEALRLVVEYVAAHHPNPKAFFAQPAVRTRLPASVNLSGLPCPDMPELASEPMTGLGRALPL
jgi:hypothetical protein